MVLKKLVSFMLLLVCFAVFLCGCTTQQITSPENELMDYRWEKSDKYGKRMSLSFDENTASLKIITTDFDYTITGTALVDSETIKISDDNLKQTYSFGYILYGDKIEIAYGENRIELDKIT
ncbi:MAG: hypothetical protein UD936_08555 [Acutalibacteraceae bacterium]|nr:hypothetical protein [Acutalibacteraceae bacterium]